MAEPPTPATADRLGALGDENVSLRARLAEAERRLDYTEKAKADLEAFLEEKIARYREALERKRDELSERIAEAVEEDYEPGDEDTTDMLVSARALRSWIDGLLAGVDVPKGPLFHNVEQSGVRVDVPKGPERWVEQSRWPTGNYTGAAGSDVPKDK